MIVFLPSPSLVMKQHTSFLETEVHKAINTASELSGNIQHTRMLSPHQWRHLGWCFQFWLWGVMMEHYEEVQLHHHLVRLGSKIRSRKDMRILVEPVSRTIKTPCSGYDKTSPWYCQNILYKECCWNVLIAYVSLSITLLEGRCYRHNCPSQPCCWAGP